MDLEAEAVGSRSVTNVFFELLEERRPLKLLESDVDAAESDGVVAELTLDGEFVIEQAKVDESYELGHDEVEFERWVGAEEKQVGYFLRNRPLNSKIYRIEYFHFSFDYLIDVIFKLTKA